MAVRSLEPPRGLTPSRNAPVDVLVPARDREGHALVELVDREPLRRVNIPPTRTRPPSAPFWYSSEVGFDGSNRNASWIAFRPRVKWYTFWFLICGANIR
jgi:hypothetical protein